MLTDAEGRAATSSLLAAARSSQQTWRETGLAEREKTLCRLRQELFSRRQQLLHELSGCRPRRQAELLSSELIPLLDSCRYLEKHTRSLLKPRRIGWSGRPNWLFGIELEELREPHGLILIIGPSNYPLFLPGSQALFALAAGNGVAFKPAPGCSAPLRLLAEAIRAAGMPEGLVTLLPEEPEGLDQVLPQVDKLVLTGSQKTGEQVLPMAARHLISGVAELSGCDLLWAHPEADLDLVASAAVFALSLNAGRTCMAPRRLLVADNLLAQFREALARAIAQRGSFVLEPSISSRVAEALQGEPATLSSTTAVRSFSVGHLNFGAMGFSVP